jgi:hypothetical protein
VSCVHAFVNCRGDDDIDAKRSRPSIGKTRGLPREKERVLLFGTRSADHIRASGHSSRIQRPYTWLHPNVSLKCPISLAPRAPSIHGRPASWPAGRVSEPPADEVTSPIPGAAPAPSIGRHRLTSLEMSEMGSFSFSWGATSNDSFARTHPSDLARVFFRCLFDPRRGNCGIAAMIRIFSAKTR